MTANSMPEPTSWWQRPEGILALAVLCAAALLPASVPILIDLPAHLSRYHVQQHIGQSPDLARHFIFEWRFIPNLGVDLAVAALAPLIGEELATRIIVALIPGGMVAAMMWCAREVHGRIPWTALFALPLAFGYPLMFGFVNYWMGAALALATFALWVRLTRRGRTLERSIAIALLSPLVLVAHLTGYGILGLLCFGSIVGREFEAAQPLPVTIGRAIIACLPMTWPLVLLAIWQGGNSQMTGIWFDFDRIGIWMIGIVRTKWMALDIASAVILYAVALLPILVHRHFRYALELAVPAGLIALCVALLPRQINGSDYASVRLIPIGCALAILAVRPRGVSFRGADQAALGFVAIRLLTVVIAVVQASAQAAAELRALDPIARGSRVAAFHVSPCAQVWEPRYLVHIQSMATARRDAMVNDQFVAANGQLMRLRDDGLRPLPSNDVRPPGCLRPGSDPFDRSYGKVDLGENDYLWIIDRAGVALPRDPRLHRIWSAGRSVMFKIDRTGASSNSASAAGLSPTTPNP